MEEREAIQQLIRAGDLPTREKIVALLNNPVTQTQAVAQTTSVEILQKAETGAQKFLVKDFTTHFRNRYEFIKNLLVNRPEVEGAISISKAKVHDKATLIAIVSELTVLPTGTIKLTLEDTTGRTTAIMSAKNQDLMKKAQSLTPDEICAFKGSISKNVFFVDDIVWPDIPQKQRSNSAEDVYVAFTGDLHVGSKQFLPREFEKFVSWLRGEVGDDKQKEIARRTKYVVVLGDIVDGVGIYPEQEKELEIKDIYKQYEAAAMHLASIPSDKQIIIIPGNHDAVRICEPQPELYKDMAAALYALPNVLMLPNPVTVRLHKQDNFPGVEILLYHGYSFDHFVDTVETLRLAGGYDAPDKIIEFLLKRRHLAPTHGSTLALPLAKDPLIIQSIPDIVATGHIHKAKIGQYKNTLTISCSCWQSKTSFQERVGHNPDPAMVPIVNLKTWKATMLSFKD